MSLFTTRSTGYKVDVPGSVSGLSRPTLSPEPLHLLVCGSLDYACVYEYPFLLAFSSLNFSLLLNFSLCDSGVETKGLSTPVLLPQSDSHDSILCSHVADIDFDGRNEIILGTYGQTLLVYQGGQSNGTFSRILSSPKTQFFPH